MRDRVLNDTKSYKDNGSSNHNHSTVAAGSLTETQ